MKLHDIRSARLPDIADAVKECVNMGEWLLFKTDVPQAVPGASFFLKTGTSTFALNDRGGILHEVAHGNGNLEIDELFYFSDIGKPNSLSNMVI